ncbi:MAG TPA: M24 family metallopeptidase [Melioribacteraceae bacterium]|nr:M24 family metallopeptidase [Melioribacteraceae bacterium]
MNKDLILQKQQQAIELLKEKDIDMWLTFVRETGNIKDPMMDMLVGTGATWHSAFILTKSGDTVAVIGSLEEANLKSVGTFKEIKSYLKSVKDDFLEVIKRYDPKSIAINFSRNSSLADGLTYGCYLELIDLLKDTPYAERLISSEGLVAALRGRKSDAEIELMQTAIKETIRIFNEVTDFIKPGKTEKDVADFVKGLVEQRGYGLAWDEEHCPAVFTGPDSAGAHSGPTNRVIERGHILNMDFGLNINGYCSDLQRTWYILRENEEIPPAEVLHGFNTILESVTLSAEALKPGKLGCEIDDVARNYIIEKGYSEYPHALGHQIGRVAHDGGALLSPRWERYGNLPYMPVEKNQVFTIEPRLSVPGFGVATVEEEVLITDDGCKFISERQKEIYLVK